MALSHRREFLHEVGEGMLAVLIGPALAAQLGLAADRTDGDDKTAGGNLAKLADLLQQTPTDRLLPTLADQLSKRVSLRDLIAAGAIANARAFGGQDYNGYHTFMALCPAYAMAMALPEKERPLPIFKVLYRNSQYIHGGSCQKNNKIASVKPATLKDGVKPHEQLRAAARQHKIDEAEGIFAAMKADDPKQDYDDIQPLVQDDLNVHRVVLAWRAWEVLDFTGKEHARGMLRQSVRFCADAKQQNRQPSPIREVLPKLLESHKLLAKKPGTKKVDDAWIEKVARTIYSDKRDRAAETVAAALADGVSPEAVGEAMSLASTWLVLGDSGMPKAWATKAKPEGSVHGASVGVHASDAANAWRHIAAVTNARNCFASLIVGAYHTAGQGDRQMAKMYPLAEDIDRVESKDATKLLALLEEAITGKDQKRACAVTSRYGALNLDAKPLVAVLRKHAVSDDGALHAEKYFQTANEEYARGRAAFRWQHMVALARVTASQAGQPAAGMSEARKVLKV